MDGGIEIDTKKIYLFIECCIFILVIILGLHIITLGRETIGSIIITGAFAGLSIYLAIKTSIIMESVREADIQDVIIKSLEIRRRLFDDIRLFKENKLKPKEIRGSFEWATWLNYRIIIRATKYKKYLLDSENDKDKSAILDSHRILIENIMKKEHIKKKILIKRHVNQLLMGCEKLKEELDCMVTQKKDYEKEYIKLFKDFLLPMEKDESFLSWIRRNMVQDKNEDELFQKIE